MWKRILKNMLVIYTNKMVVKNSYLSDAKQKYCYQIGSKVEES